jgi:plasmid stability protein
MEERPMATLNVKNLPDPLYRKLQARARRQRRSLAQEVIHLLTQALEEVWKGVDAAAHVDTERRSWD